MINYKNFLKIIKLLTRNVSNGGPDVEETKVPRRLSPLTSLS